MVKKIILDIPDEQNELLKDLSDKTGVPKTSIVKLALSKYLENET